MVLLAALVLWVAASLVVAGLCVAAARGDAKQAMAIRLGAHAGAGGPRGARFQRAA